MYSAWRRFGDVSSNLLQTAGEWRGLPPNCRQREGDVGIRRMDEPLAEIKDVAKGRIDIFGLTLCIRVKSLRSRLCKY